MFCEINTVTCTTVFFIFNTLVHGGGGNFKLEIFFAPPVYTQNSFLSILCNNLNIRCASFGEKNVTDRVVIFMLNMIYRFVD